MNKKIVAIVVNYKNETDTWNCLKALRQSRDVFQEICLINNGGPENGKDSYAADHIIRTRNRGFAAACNEGIRWAMDQKADFVWLVNNDLKVETDTLTELLKAVEGRNKIACAGPKIVYDREPAGVQFAGGFIREDEAYWFPRGDFEEDRGQYETVEEADWISGACMLMNVEAVSSVGFMDEKYFLYYEDVDWCLRAEKQGWRCLYVGTSRVRHKASQSTQGVKNYYYPRAHFLFLAKHYPDRVEPAMRRYYHHVLRPHFVQRAWRETFTDLRVYKDFLWFYFQSKAAGHPR